MLIAYPAYQALACLVFEDKQCRSPRCWSGKPTMDEGACLILRTRLNLRDPIRRG